ncbi:Pol polyprotein [Elysia marginata]|uniref:Pol polyprotein n=1 Tax=Elysia marginata TaxID=1093978 RepID=A0AAV4GMH6_9GAST|nr:Pol polyprotein [Elysia marginata]
MVVDQFTKWVECQALPDQTAVTTSEAMVEIFSRLGYPFEIFTDQGRNFESDLFRSVCKLLHVHKARTTPYHPSSNGQVGRFNRTLLDSVRCFVQDQEDWDRYLPQIAAALRSSINRNTGFTPDKLMLGREVVTPLELVYATNTGGRHAKGSLEYVVGLERELGRCHEVARETLCTKQKHMKKSNDVRLHKYSHDLDQVIYVLDAAVKVGESSKLSSPWKGPGVILKVLTPYLYEIRVKRRSWVVNHDRLKPCRIPPDSWPIWIKNHFFGSSRDGEE